MLDLRIVGGSIVDGLGAEPFSGDIGITGDTITAIGDLSHAAARLTIDLANDGQGASSRIVCPGFIDVHSHSDTHILIEPSSPSKVHQGITTEVLGNCGTSAAPRLGQYRVSEEWRKRAYPGQWRTVADYRALLDQVAPAPNVVLLIGHGNLRAAVAGYGSGPLDAADTEKMVRLLEEALDQGGRGLSSGLIYPPGMFAGHEELAALAAAAARRDGVYATHMRSEGDRLLESVEETLSVGRDAGVRVEISHLKAHGSDNWGMLERVLDTISKARKEGVAVAADRYPYTSGWTTLDIVLPAWFHDGGNEAAMSRLGNASERAKARKELLDAGDGRDWADITVGSTHSPETRRFQGTPLLDVAHQLGMDPVDAVLHLVEHDRLATGAFFESMDPRNMRRILREPYVMLGSDASLRAPEGPFSEDFPHPRAYGAFPRFLRMVLDEGLVPLPEAVRKMTSLPADHFRLTGRGVLREGNKADIVVFNPGQVRDIATFVQPHKLAQGIEYVIVNGVLTLERGKLTGRRAGRIL
ncbi:amidohydrolase family protein [Verrucomicrobiota bacterium]